MKGWVISLPDCQGPWETEGLLLATRGGAIFVAHDEKTKTVLVRAFRGEEGFGVEVDVPDTAVESVLRYCATPDGDGRIILARLVRQAIAQT